MIGFLVKEICDDDGCFLACKDCGKVRVLVDYVLPALWWLKSPMQDAHDLLHFGQMNASKRYVIIL
jgi:hypothetical protein